MIGNAVKAETKDRDRGKKKPQETINPEIGETTEANKMTDEGRITGKASHGTRETNSPKDLSLGDSRQSKFRSTEN